MLKNSRQLTIPEDNYNKAKKDFDRQKGIADFQPVSIVQHAKTGRYACFIVHKAEWINKHYPNFKIIETTENE